MKESESGAGRRKKKVMEKTGAGPDVKTAEGKMQILRKCGESRYSGLPGAVYKYRGLNSNGGSAAGYLQKTWMSLPEVIDVVRDYQ
ncbi:MAG TPA: hypothetical protein PLX08_01105 [Bacteroidales bacterium]|jgi:hypothetical protein|nr:hypothetical protein [Bacteroidales bacterium]